MAPARPAICCPLRRANWQGCDWVVTFSAGLFQHYAPGLSYVIPLRLAALEEQVDLLAADGGALWIVVPVSRGGLTEDVRSLLDSRARREAVFTRRRFDYQVNEIDVYHLEP